MLEMRLFDDCWQGKKQEWDRSEEVRSTTFPFPYMASDARYTSRYSLLQIAHHPCSCFLSRRERIGVCSLSSLVFLPTSSASSSRSPPNHNLQESPPTTSTSPKHACVYSVNRGTSPPTSLPNSSFSSVASSFGRPLLGPPAKDSPSLESARGGDQSSLRTRNYGRTSRSEERAQGLLRGRKP